MKSKTTNEIFYFDGENDICDYYIRYENLKNDLMFLEGKYDMDLFNILPMTKHLFRKDRRPAAEILDNDQLIFCYEKHRKQFERFNYEKII